MSSKTIVCFGDSNTHGYDSSTGGRFSEKERWTCLLQEMLPSDYLIREEGLSGRTTSFQIRSLKVLTVFLISIPAS